jgi:hypothetical protein
MTPSRRTTFPRERTRSVARVRDEPGAKFSESEGLCLRKKPDSSGNRVRTCVAGFRGQRPADWTIPDQAGSELALPWSHEKSAHVAVAAKPYDRDRTATQR